MSLIHCNAPAENSMSRWISLKVHGLIPSRSHLPVRDQSRQAHTQEECKVVHPVAKQAKIAHEEQVSPTFCSSWRGGRQRVNIPILLWFCHLFATQYSPPVQSFFPLMLPISFFSRWITWNNLLYVLLGNNLPLPHNISPGRNSNFGHPTPCQGSREKSVWKAQGSPWERNLLNVCLNNTDCKINNRKLQLLPCSLKPITKLHPGILHQD